MASADFSEASHISACTTGGSQPPRFLVFATPLDPRRGVTGATLGTSLVAKQVSDKCEVVWVHLKSYGLRGAGNQNAVRKFATLVRAAVGTLYSFFHLALRGMNMEGVKYFYFIPSASLGGSLRDFMLTLLIRVFFRQAEIAVHIHNGNYFERRGSLQSLFRNFVVNRARYIFILSTRLLPEGADIPASIQSKIQILPNTVDTELIPDRDKVDAKLDRGEGPIRVLFFSNFIQAKGHWTLLEAGALLAEWGLADAFRFTFHGKWLSNDDRHAFRARAAEIAKSGLRIEVGESVADRRQAQKLYLGHDVFCLPTSYAAEAQPRVVLEAMANACAVIATDYRSIPDMVIDGRNGILIDRRETALLADALRALKRRDLASMQVESRRLFEERFSPETVRRRLHQALGL